MIRKCLLLATLLSYLVACAGLERPVGTPPVDVPAEALNTDIRVFALDGWNTFRIDDPLTLSVEVMGDDEIVFPPDFGVKMFLYDAGDWVEIEGVATEYSGGAFVLSPSNGNPLLVGDTTVFPILPDPDKPATLRIFVTGHFYRHGKATDERVGAYVDLVLKP
jgi:hypothetical protein